MTLRGLVPNVGALWLALAMGITGCSDESGCSGRLDPCDVRDEDCFDCVVSYTERARGLVLERPIRAEIISQEEFVALAEAESQDSPATMFGGAPAEVLVRFGLVGSVDTLEEANEELNSGVLGFYQPGADVVWLVDTGSDSQERSAAELADEMAVIAHEVTHALQDQHFGLNDLLLGQPPTMDAEEALRSLVEGDATLSMINYLLLARGDEAWGDGYYWEAVPGAVDQYTEEFLADTDEPFILGMLFFWYNQGTKFVLEAALGSEDPNATIDAMYGQPPVTTRMVLDFAEYQAWLDGEQLQQLVEPAGAPPVGESGYEEWEGMDLGEWGTQLFLRRHTDAAEAVRAARGLMADRIRWFYRESDDRWGAIWLSAWSADPDVRDFLDVYSRKVLPPVEDLPYVGRTGNRALVVVGFEPQDAEAICTWADTICAAIEPE